MDSIKFAFVGVALSVAIAFSYPAYATPISDPLLSFGITGLGNYTVNTGDITAATISKTIPTLEYAGGTTTPVTFAEAGLSTGLPITFSTDTFNTFDGPDAFTLVAGDLTFSFQTVSSVAIVPTTATTQGSISEQFSGLVSGDTSGFGFLNQTVSLSETCTQTSLGASITCSESIQTPGLPVPEPASLSLFGVALLGLGLFGYRRKRA